MAPIKIERVVSVSSEDPNHAAENLLKIDYSNKKWKCKTPGEKQISVVLQLAKSTKIIGFDIGNENSAFIEILVSTSSAPDDYKVLLITSSLMSLNEAKNGENINGVKFFKNDALCDNVKDDKWDRVKIVCSQPYNKFQQYGLSFIVLHGESNSDDVKPPTSFGRFQLKVDTKDDQTILKAGGLFAKRKELDDLPGPAAIHAASNNVNKIKLPTAYQPDSSSSSPTTSNEVKPKKPRTPRVKKDTARPKNRNGVSDSDDDQPSTSTKGTKRVAAAVGTTKPKLASPKKAKVVKAQAFKKRAEKPFNLLFEGVVFTISGFQNPFRSDLRNKALAMGAKYKADWDNTCTHLICAFANTPKYNQVRGRGKIVKKEWIEDSHSRRIAFPWRRYALDPNDISQPESDEEIYEKVDRPDPVDHRRTVNTDESSGDTEDEIERVRQTQNKNASPQVAATNRVTNLNAAPLIGIATPQASSSSRQQSPSPSPDVPEPDNVDMPAATTSNASVFDMETDEGEYDLPDVKEEIDNLPYLPTIFGDITFLILDDLELAVRAKLKRYIIAHKGVVATDSTNLNDVEYVISEDPEAVSQVKEQFPQVTGVKPEWVWRAHDENRLLPTSPFEL